MTAAPASAHHATGPAGAEVTATPLSPSKRTASAYNVTAAVGTTLPGHGPARVPVTATASLVASHMPPTAATAYSTHAIPPTVRATTAADAGALSSAAVYVLSLASS